MPEQPTTPRSQNPYVGPKPFTTAEQDLFFGRQAEIPELTSLIVSRREVVLYSQSGAGKTSLLRAGIYPRLESRGFEVLPPARVVGPPLPESDAESQTLNVYTRNVLRGWAPSGTDVAALRSQTLHQFFARLTEKAGTAKRLRIVIFDQFEELFTTYVERWKDRERFLRQVAEALEQDRSLRVVFAMREEFVGRLRRFGEMFPDGLRHWFYLERLREGPALDAVKLPAANAGRPYQDGVAETIVERLLPVRVRTEAGKIKEIPGEFVEPVHLQIVCRRIWDRLGEAEQAEGEEEQKEAAEDEARKITAEHVSAHGDITEALREYYEDRIAEVSKQTNISRKQLRRWFERKFITEEGGRSRVFEQDGRVAGMPLIVARKFQEAYLLRSDSQGDAVWFELAHDRLLGPVQMARQHYQRRILVNQLTAALSLVMVGAIVGGLIVYRAEPVPDPPQPAVIAIRARAHDTPAAQTVESTAKAAPSDIQLITIPVVVHIVYSTPEQNVSDAQVASQIQSLNEDFRARNADIVNVPEPFKPAIGDAYIRFAPATKDPQGRPTNGITRHQTSTRSFTFDDGIKAGKTGGADPWRAQRYLNIWVGNLTGGILAYAQFPGGPSLTDGVVIHYEAFGQGGSAKAPFNLGRSATHAIGQYLNLRNIWGDTPDCSGSDNVADTPNQAGPTLDTPQFPHFSCPNEPHGDMFMNFMDYGGDKALLMFTRGQVARMRETLTTFRRGLWAQ